MLPSTGLECETETNQDFGHYASFMAIPGSFQATFLEIPIKAGIDPAWFWGKASIALGSTGPRS